MASHIDDKPSAAEEIAGHVSVYSKVEQTSDMMTWEKAEERKIKMKYVFPRS